MASSYQLENVSYDPFDVVMGGPLFAYNGGTFISPLSVLTEGFIYNEADIWVRTENCEEVTWTVVP